MSTEFGIRAPERYVLVYDMAKRYKTRLTYNFALNTSVIWQPLTNVYYVKVFVNVFVNVIFPATPRGDVDYCIGRLCHIMVFVIHLFQ